MKTNPERQILCGTPLLNLITKVPTGIQQWKVTVQQVLQTQHGKYLTTSAVFFTLMDQKHKAEDNLYNRKNHQWGNCYDVSLTVVFFLFFLMKMSIWFSYMLHAWGKKERDCNKGQGEEEEEEERCATSEGYGWSEDTVLGMVIRDYIHCILKVVKPLPLTKGKSSQKYWE